MKASMKSCFPMLLLICVSASQGCAWLQRLDTNRNTELAQLDHRNCEERGYAWPGKAYVDCRRFLVDDRQREQWMELQMSRQQQQPHVGIRPQSPTEAYRPIDETQFGCTMVGEGADAWIECGENGR